MSASERKKKWEKKIHVNMKRIYTKFYVGDKAWIMLHNKVQQVTIEGIRYFKDGLCEFSIGNSSWYSDEKLHQTKQALWQSLMNQFEKERDEQRNKDC